jgi:hypothetical protein
VSRFKKLPLEQVVVESKQAHPRESVPHLGILDVVNVVCEEF